MSATVTLSCNYHMCLPQVVMRGFNADCGLFTATSEALLYPCPAADKFGSGLQLLEFLGALYHGTLFLSLASDTSVYPSNVADKLGSGLLEFLGVILEVLCIPRHPACDPLLYAVPSMMMCGWNGVW